MECSLNYLSAVSLVYVIVNQDVPTLLLSCVDDLCEGDMPRNTCIAVHRTVSSLHIRYTMRSLIKLIKLIPTADARYEIFSFRFLFLFKKITVITP